MGGLSAWIAKGLNLEEEENLEGWVVQAWLPFHPNLFYRSYGISICLVIIFNNISKNF